MYVKILPIQPNIVFKTQEEPKPSQNGVQTAAGFSTRNSQTFSQAQAQSLKNNVLARISFKGNKELTLEEFLKEIETNPEYKDFKRTFAQNPRIREEIKAYEYPIPTLQQLKNNLKIAQHIKQDYPEMYEYTEGRPSRLQILMLTNLSEKDYKALRDNNLLEANPQKPYFFYNNLFNKSLKNRDLTNNINLLKELKQHPELQNVFGGDKIYHYVKDCLEKEMPIAVHPSQNKNAVEVFKLLEEEEYKKVLGEIYTNTKINWFFQDDFESDKVKKVFDYLKDLKTDSDELNIIGIIFDNNSLKKVSGNFEQLKSSRIKKPFWVLFAMRFYAKGDLFETLDYIKNSKMLSELNINLSEILKSLKKNENRKTKPDLSIERLKPELDKLEKLKEIGDEKVFKAAGGKIINNLLKGVKNAADFNPDGVVFLKELGEKSPQTLKNISKNITAILKDKTLKKPILERNLKLLERILTTDEFRGLRDNKDFQKSKFLTYKGDLEKLCKTYEAKMDDRHNWWGRLKIKFLNNNKVSIEDTKDYPSSRTDIFDESMELISSEKKSRKTTEVGNCIQYFDINDIKNNAEYSIIGSKPHLLSEDKEFVLQEMRTKTKDAANNIISEETLETADIDGVYNIYKTDKNGKVETLSYGIQNEKGIVIEKKLPSLNGETTYLNYFQNPEKTFEEFHYVIKDKNENILAQRHTSLKQLSENAFENIIDGIKYDINHNTDGGVEIYNHNTQKTTKFSLSYQEDFKTKLQNLVKTLSADELERFPDGIGRIESSAEGTGYMRSYKKLLQTDSQRFTLLHEVGHGKKFPTADGMLSQTADEFFAENAEFVKIYKEEMALIDKKLPPRIKKIIYYFLEKQKSKGGFTDPIRETAAEINAIINSPIFCKNLKGRTHFIQRYLPRTIAFVLNHRP